MISIVSKGLYKKILSEVYKKISLRRSKHKFFDLGITFVRQLPKISSIQYRRSLVIKNGLGEGVEATTSAALSGFALYSLSKRGRDIDRIKKLL
jgi:hypothetical protein